MVEDEEIRNGGGRKYGMNKVGPAGIEPAVLLQGQWTLHATLPLSHAGPRRYTERRGQKSLCKVTVTSRTRAGNTRHITPLHSEGGKSHSAELR